MNFLTRSPIIIQKNIKKQIYSITANKITVKNSLDLNIKKIIDTNRKTINVCYLFTLIDPARPLILSNAYSLIGHPDYLIDNLMIILSSEYDDYPNLDTIPDNVSFYE